MNLAQNLQFLRKRDKITQEELADRLGVSRQSVSKWETGEAYPETEKLILLSDMFGVTLDDLMRGDVAQDAQADNPVADKAEVKKHFDKFSKAMALGVFLVLIGVSVCVALAGFAQTLPENTSNIVSIMGAVALLLFIAVACIPFIIYGTAHDRFKKCNAVLECPFDAGEIKAFSKKYAITMSCLVAGFFVDIIYLLVLSNLIGEGFIAVANEDGAFCYVLCSFFVVLAFLFGGMTLLGVKHSVYNIEKYNKDNTPSPRKKLIDAICGAIMLTATALFLILGFVSHLWHPAWIAFPVGGIVCGIVSTIGNRE